MSPPEVHVVSHEELVELLDELFNQRPPHTTEEIQERYERTCRLAYGVTRREFESDDASLHGLMGTAFKHTRDSNGVPAAAGALLLDAACRFLDDRMAEDLERFKTQFIHSLDEAVQHAHVALGKSNDTSTKQSTEECSAQSHKTP